MKPVIQAGCMDCGLVTNHDTRTQAVASAQAHMLEQPTHRGLVADPGNGWHRAWAADKP